MKATFQIMKINDSLVKNYLVLFSRYLSDYYYFKHGMEYFMWNFYISSVKKGEGLLHACISSGIQTMNVYKCNGKNIFVR